MSIAQNYPEIKPSLNLDFANVKKLDPRVTFARASEGRYYDGVTTAKAEENLILRSQEFDNASWTYNSVSTVVNTTVAPDSTTTADTLAFVDASTSRGYQGFTGNGLTFTFSVFFKYIDKQWIAIRLTDSGNISRFVWFDIQNGVVGTTETGITASIVASANGFYRCIATIATTAVSNFAMIYGVNGDNSVSNAGQTGSVAVWGAQLEQRSSVTSYTPTTTQPITNYIPALQTASANVARFDHDPVTGESLGLLVEEQRTNLLTYSSEFDNAVWQKAKTTVTPNVAVAPDGTLTGDKLVLSVSTSGGTRVQQVVSTSSTTYTVSYKIKYAGRRYIVIGLYNSTSNNAGAGFDLIDGTVTGLSSIGAGYASSNASITPIGNGWYSCSVTVTVGTSTANACPIYFSPTAFLGGVETIYQEDTTGDGYSGIFIWGAQLETGAFPTSYIPTTSSQVTRSADAASMTGENFEEWYRQDEGTIVLTGQRPVSSGGSVQIDDGTNNNRFIITGNSNNTDIGYCIVGGATQAAMQTVTTNTGTVDIKALAYKTNDFAYAKNGLTPITDTNGILPVVNRLSVTSTASSHHIRKISYYPQALSATQLQALTGS